MRVQRSIEAPDKEWLDAKEAGDWLNIGESAFSLLVREGILKRGKRMKRDKVVWHWDYIFAVSQAVKHDIIDLDHRPAGKPAKKSRERDSGDGAQ